MAFYANKAHEIVGVLFWFKIITLAIIIYSATVYKEQELYYYQNLGISKLRLIISISSFDFALWLTLMLITLKAI